MDIIYWIIYVVGVALLIPAVKLAGLSELDKGDALVAILGWPVIAAVILPFILLGVVFLLFEYIGKKIL